MAIDFRRHDAMAKYLTPSAQKAYGLKKSTLIKTGVPQSEADEGLNAFFWQCFEDCDEDEDNGDTP